MNAVLDERADLLLALLKLGNGLKMLFLDGSDLVCILEAVAERLEGVVDALEDNLKRWTARQNRQR